MKRIYDQARLCNNGNSSCCPVVDQDETNGTLTLSDPAAPEKGSFAFKDKAEYNTFLANAPKA